MGVAAQPLLSFEGTYADALPELSRPWRAASFPAPQLLALNEPLAQELGIEDPAAFATPAGVALLLGADLPEGVQPVAQAYAGHQFGGFSPQLGDGRALLLGEVLDREGRRRDVHLKGSGRTPFARGGDGKAAIGPMLREFVVSEAMHALGIPTTRSLAVIATGETVVRDAMLPGAVLVRVAASHLRVGTFQYAAVHLGPDVVRRLADYAIARHHPDVAEADEPYLALLERVLDRQAALVAQWMLVGFIHGVMNTDNMTISGETIDYGPCAFLEAYDPAAVFSSIDTGGRYAFGNQPAIAQWDLARLAEALLPLIDSDADRAIQRATDLLNTFPDRYTRAWRAGMVQKLGLAEEPPDDGALLNDLLASMHERGLDWTAFFRDLAASLRGDALPLLETWTPRWRAELEAQGRDPAAAAEQMDRVNPLYIPRNERVEEALAAATGGDLEPLGRLVDVVTRPFEERPGLERYAEPASATFTGNFRTFCGT